MSLCNVYEGEKADKAIMPKVSGILLYFSGTEIIIKMLTD